MRDTSLDSWMHREDEVVVSALAQAGIAAKSVYDLVNSREPYPEAIAVLIEMLPVVQHRIIKEGVVRALTVKEAKPIAARPLLDEFRKAEPEADMLKWAIANALTVVADDRVFDDIVELLRDKSHGHTREMLAWSLGNMRDPRAVDVLVEMLDDEEVAGHAIYALGKLKAKSARAKIERFLDHPKTWFRNEAKKALRKIDKAK